MGRWLRLNFKHCWVGLDNQHFAMNTSHSQPAIPDPLVTSTSIKSTSAVKEARRLAESVERISKEASAKSAAARAFVATNPGVASTSNFSTASAASNERQPRLLTAVRFLCEYPPAQLQWLDKYLSNQHATIGGVLPLSGVQHLADLQGYSTRFVDSDQRMFVLAQQQHYAHAQNLAAVTAAATAAARSSVGAAKAHPASAKVADEPTGINATMSRESPASAKRKVPGSAQKGASKSSTVEQGVSAKRLRSVPQHKQVRKGLKPSAASSLARPSYVSPKANVCKSAASSSPRARYKSPARSKSFLERKSSVCCSEPKIDACNFLPVQV